MNKWPAALVEGDACRVDVIRANVLAGVAHGFLGRVGGVSTGVVAGLQVGLMAGDDEDHVAENRARAVQAACPGAALVTVKQVHSPLALIADAPWPDDARPDADAIVTARRGLALAIVTADCAPILLADREAGVIGAAHAGWRGAHGGVAQQTIARMEELGAKADRIVAAIGPCIAQPNYEVGEDFREQFGAGDDCFFIPGKTGKWHFDLESYVAAQLAACGVSCVEKLGFDTYQDENRFFSHRRSVHRDEPTYGRQFSLIAL